MKPMEFRQILPHSFPETFERRQNMMKKETSEIEAPYLYIRKAGQIKSISCGYFLCHVY